MIKLRCNENCEPSYETSHSAGADLKSSETVIIPPNGQVKVATGVWIDSVQWDKVPKGMIPELQIRARSGLAYKHGITLTNAVGTIDADYRHEICVLMWNTRDKEFEVKQGDRIAQLLLNMTHRIDSIPIGGKRLGGFGSTGIQTQENSSSI